MHWLQRLFAPQSRPFIIYVSLLLALLAGALWYRGRFQQRILAQMASSVRRTLTDEGEIAKIKMERTTLELQLPNLRSWYPLLTNESLTRDWSEAAILSQLDPEVCASWRAYLDQVSPLLQEQEPSLGPYLALQEGYIAEVEPLAKDVFLHDKTAQLLNLRSNKFALLFKYETHEADAAQFERLAQSLADEKTLALRKAWEEALTAAATHLNPQLSQYARARLEFALKSDELKARVRQLNEQLGELDESPSPADQPAPLGAATGTPLEHLLRLGSFETYVPREKDFLAIELATALLGFLITQPVEMRDRRWLKIGASVALVYVGLFALRIPVSLAPENRGINVFAFFGFLVPAALVAAIWAPCFASFLSQLSLQLIDPSGPDQTEDTRLKPAYDAARQGQYRLALKLLKPKLLLDPRNYEALVLKARLHRQLDRKWRAKWTLAKVLRNRQLTASQLDHADYLRRNLANKTDPCWTLVKREVPRHDFEELLDF
jgi:hypothetical protein